MLAGLDDARRRRTTTSSSTGSPTPTGSRSSATTGCPPTTAPLPRLARLARRRLPVQHRVRRGVPARPGRAVDGADRSARVSARALSARTYTGRPTRSSARRAGSASSRWSTGCPRAALREAFDGLPVGRRRLPFKVRSRSRCGSPPPTTSGCRTATAATTPTSRSTSTSARPYEQYFRRFEAIMHRRSAAARTGARCTSATRRPWPGVPALRRLHRAARQARPRPPVRQRLHPDRVPAAELLPHRRPVTSPDFDRAWRYTRAGVSRAGTQPGPPIRASGHAAAAPPQRRSRLPARGDPADDFVLHVAQAWRGGLLRRVPRGGLLRRGAFFAAASSSWRPSWSSSPRSSSSPPSWRARRRRPSSPPGGPSSAPDPWPASRPASRSPRQGQRLDRLAAPQRRVELAVGHVRAEPPVLDDQRLLGRPGRRPSRAAAAWPRPGPGSSARQQRQRLVQGDREELVLPLQRTRVVPRLMYGPYRPGEAMMSSPAASLPTTRGRVSSSSASSRVSASGDSRGQQRGVLLAGRTRTGP